MFAVPIVGARYFPHATDFNKFDQAQSSATATKVIQHPVGYKFFPCTSVRQNNTTNKANSTQVYSTYDISRRNNHLQRSYRAWNKYPTTDPHYAKNKTWRRYTLYQQCIHAVWSSCWKKSSTTLNGNRIHNTHRRHFMTIYKTVITSNQLAKLINIQISMFHRAFFKPNNWWIPTHALFHIQHSISLEC